MEYNIKQMNYDNAKKISKWIYQDSYSIYSMDGSDDCIKELLEGLYYSVTDNKDNIIGYYCFGEAARVPAGKQFGVYDNNDIIDIGLGISPNLCGMGLGYDFLRNGLDFAQNQLSAKGFRLTVASFNQRAVKVYRRVGFQIAASFERVSKDNNVEFLIMVLLRYSN